ncbi:MAG: four helix bundle protein [Bacteroidales bacterium]|nr:four helix bundle protein [Bacteroidales bacterium]
MSRGNFESLRVWQNARTFVNSIYDIMDNNKDFGFRDQIQRAAISIMNNISEGYESGSDAKYVNFLNIAKGSCSEVRSMLYVCLDRKYCSQEQFDVLKSQAIHISSQLYKLIEFLNKK